MKKIFFLILLFLLIPQLGQAKVYLKVNNTEIVKGDRVKVYGYVKPKKKNIKVRIYRKYDSGQWKYIKTKTTKKNGRFNYYTRPSKDVYYRAKTKKNGKWTWGNKKKSVEVSLYPKCGDDYVWFSQNLMSEGAYTQITPLGAVNPSAHTFPTDHMYLALTDYLSAQPIYAPGEIWVEQISTSEHLSVDPVFTDYTITFRSCAKFHNFLMHVSGITPELQEAYDNGEEIYGDCSEYTAGDESYRMCTRSVRVKMKAGDLLGYAGGNEGQMALDWGAYDTRVDIEGVANEERWGEQVLYNVCPLDYYDTTMQDYLYGYITRVEELRCGDINQDVAATAQGRWFLTGTEGNSWQEDHQLALIHNETNFSMGLFSVGDSVNSLSSGEYTFTPQDSGYVNRDFDQLTADGQIYCYQTDQEEVILIQLTDDSSLRIEAQSLSYCNSGPWSFADNYTDFIR